MWDSNPLEKWSPLCNKLKVRRSTLSYKLKVGRHTLSYKLKVLRRTLSNKLIVQRNAIIHVLQYILFIKILQYKKEEIK